MAFFEFTNTTELTDIDAVVTAITDSVISEGWAVTTDAQGVHHLRAPAWQVNIPAYFQLFIESDCLVFRGARAYDSSKSATEQDNLSPKSYIPINSIVAKWMWLSVNHFRICGVVRNVSVYHSFYAGFLRPMATPSETPYPMYIGGTANEAILYDATNAEYRTPADPGAGCNVLSLSNSWTEVRNHNAGSTSDNLWERSVGGCAVAPPWPGADDDHYAYHMRWVNYVAPPAAPVDELPVQFKTIYFAEHDHAPLGIIDGFLQINSRDRVPEQQISLNAQQAEGLATFTANPSDGDTLTVGSSTYTFNTTETTVNGSVGIDTTLLLTLRRLVLSINGSIQHTTKNSDAITFVNGNDDGLVLKAVLSGSDGDNIALTTTSSSITLSAFTGGSTPLGGYFFPNLNRVGAPSKINSRTSTGFCMEVK